MGSRTRNHDKGGRRRVKWDRGMMLRVPGDPDALPNAVFAFLKKGSPWAYNVEEVAEDCSACERSRMVASYALNVLRNQGRVIRMCGVFNVP